MKRKDRAELAKRNIGMVFQSYHLLDDLTVAENIDLPLSYKDIPRSERQAMVADTLDRFQIVAKKDLYPSQLSGGQQQLVGIARAVIHKPALLLADEPTGNLHSSQAKEIMELFAELNRQGTTIVQVTHSDVNASYGSRARSIFAMDGWSAIPATQISLPPVRRCVMMRADLKVAVVRGPALCAAGERTSPNSDNAITGYRHLPMRTRTSRLRRGWLCRIPGNRLMPTARIRFRSRSWPTRRGSIN